MTRREAIVKALRLAGVAGLSTLVDPSILVRNISPLPCDNDGWEINPDWVDAPYEMAFVMDDNSIVDISYPRRFRFEHGEYVEIDIVKHR